MAAGRSPEQFNVGVGWWAVGTRWLILFLHLCHCLDDIKAACERHLSIHLPTHPSTHILTHPLTHPSINIHLSIQLGFPGGSVVKNPPAKQEAWVQSLGPEDSLEKEMATHSRILGWKIPCTEEPDRLIHLPIYPSTHSSIHSSFYTPTHPLTYPST